MLTNQKTAQKNKNGIKILSFTILIVLLITGCAIGPKLPSVMDKKDFIKEKYRKVGLLVVRVGNVTNIDSPVPVLISTNYATRVPKASYSLGLPTALEDVYIDDEKRLHESLPTYPRLKAFPGIQFYKNLTPVIYQTVTTVLDEKGYSVIDIRKLAEKNKLLLSELTVAEILNMASTTTDAVLILHYRDVGDITGGPRTSKGFSSLCYTFTMFDTKTKNSLLYFRQSSPNILDSMTTDNDIMNNTELKKKIHSEDDGIKNQKRITVHFSEEEIISFCMKYLRQGVKCCYNNQWEGLMEIIP